LKIPQGGVVIWDLKENVKDEYGFCVEKKLSSAFDNL